MDNKELLIKIGESIKKYRIEKGMTTKFLAKKAQISESTLAKAEKGVTNLRMTMIIEICQVLDIRLDDLTKQ